MQCEAVALVVDDDPLMREFISKILEKCAYSAVKVARGADVAPLLRASAAELVIVDIYMPDKDGLEVIREIRREFPELCIVAVSGGSDVVGFDCLRAAAALGADATLRKPFLPADLAEVCGALRRTAC